MSTWNRFRFFFPLKQRKGGATRKIKRAPRQLCVCFGAKKDKTSCSCGGQTYYVTSSPISTCSVSVFYSSFTYLSHNFRMTNNPHMICNFIHLSPKPEFRVGKLRAWAGVFQAQTKAHVIVNKSGPLKVLPSLDMPDLIFLLILK